MGAGEVATTERKNRWRWGLSILLRVGLLGIAVIVLRRELNGVGIHDLVASLRGYGLRPLVLSVAFTIASFLTLGFIELQAVRYVGKRAERAVPRRTAFATAFIAHAYSQSVGLAILTGAAVRGRSYSRYGLDALDVARLTAFVTATATLGLLTTGALAFLSIPGPVSVLGVGLPLKPLGFLLLVPVTAYVCWCALGRSDFHGRGKWRIRRPALRSALQQIGMASLDWVFAGTVLFYLLPRSLGVSYGGLLGVYLFAQTAAVISHVPGGVGVFEALVISLVTVPVEGRIVSPSILAAVAASLFVYRVIYYFLPLCAALALAAIAELIRSRRAVDSPGAVPLRRSFATPDAI